MTKTLADMTPKERLECIGMWATVDTEKFLAVIVRAYPSDGVLYAQMLAPEINDYYTSRLETITPRFDLPRAWEPDGTPLEGEWLTHGTHIRVIPKNRRAYVTMSEKEPS